MADEMLKKAEAMAGAEPEAVCEAGDALDYLREEIAKLQEKETVLTEKLCLAKEKGLPEHADKCRVLLQKVVRQRLKKQEDLRQAEARLLAAELDALTAEIGAEIDPPVETVEEELDGYDYLAKFKRMNLIAKMIGTIGVIACFLGAFVYLILTQVETLNLPFEWIHLAVVGGVAVVFVIVAAIIAGSAKKYKQIAAMIEEERAADAAELELAAKEEVFTIESLNAATEAYEIEKQLDVKKSKPENKILTALKLPDAVPEKVKQNVHKIVPIAAVCTAVVTAAAVSSARKRAAAEKRSAAARRDFFKWLG